MITVESVSRTYGTFTAVDDISFNANAGRISDAALSVGIDSVCGRAGP